MMVRNSLYLKYPFLGENIKLGDQLGWLVQNGCCLGESQVFWICYQLWGEGTSGFHGKSLRMILSPSLPSMQKNRAGGG